MKLVHSLRGIRSCEWDVVGHNARMHGVVHGQERLQCAEKHVHLRLAIRRTRYDQGHVQIAYAGFYISWLWHA